MSDTFPTSGTDQVSEFAQTVSILVGLALLDPLPSSTPAEEVEDEEEGCGDGVFEEKSVDNKAEFEDEVEGYVDGFFEQSVEMVDDGVEVFEEMVVVGAAGSGI